MAASALGRFDRRRSQAEQDILEVRAVGKEDSAMRAAMHLEDELGFAEDRIG